MARDIKYERSHQVIDVSELLAAHYRSRPPPQLQELIAQQLIVAEQRGAYAADEEIKELKAQLAAGTEDIYRCKKVKPSGELVDGCGWQGPRCSTNCPNCGSTKLRAIGAKPGGTAASLEKVRALIGDAENTLLGNSIVGSGPERLGVAMRYVCAALLELTRTLEGNSDGLPKTKEEAGPAT